MTNLIGKTAPDFTTGAVLGNGEIVDKFNLHQTIKGKTAVIFFYPLDFTFVCPSELIAFNNRFEEFKQRGTVLIGVSIDSRFTHNAWRNTPVEKGGIGAVQYPLVADVTHSICQAYGVEHPEERIALRGTFVIDKQGIVRVAHINDLPIGRNVDEYLRLVDAIEFHNKHGEVCPAGWTKGKTAIKPTAEGIASYLADQAAGL